MIDQIKDLQLSRYTVTRRIEKLSEDIICQLKEDINICVAFSLQFDESTDVRDTAQLMIFIRMVCEDCTVKEQILKLIPMHGRTRGEDIFRVFNNLLKQRFLFLNCFRLQRMVLHV